MTDFAFIRLIPFRGGSHRYSDLSGARAFVRYLFSRSERHAVGPRTRLNLITELEPGPDGSRVMSRTRNELPEILCEDFISRRMPRGAVHLGFEDDGAYALFVARCPSGALVSNFLSGRGDDLVLAGARDVLEAAGAERIVHRVRSACRGEQIINLDDADIYDHEAADAAVHAHAQDSMPGRPVLIVSHHDQRTARECWQLNPFYHVHRLVLRSNEG